MRRFPARIVAVVRINNTLHGTPRYHIVTDNDNAYRTKPYAAFNGTLSHDIVRGEWYWLTLDGRDNVTDVERYSDD